MLPMQVVIAWCRRVAISYCVVSACGNKLLRGVGVWSFKRHHSCGIIEFYLHVVSVKYTSKVLTSMSSFRLLPTTS